jgi:glycosyltransferase involved in cell wall biosynthesis
MLRLLYIAYYFPPLGGAGVQRTQKFVKYLPAEDVSPIVVTGPAPLEMENHWSPLDGTLVQEIAPETFVVRVPGPVPPAGGKWNSRLRTMLALPDPFSKWWIRAVRRAASGLTNGFDLILATLSPYDGAEAAHKLSAEFHVPWVADLRDPWALDEMQIYPSALHRKLEMLKMERLLSTAALIIMNTPDSSRALQDAFPSLRQSRIVSITNGFDRDDFSRPPSQRTDTKFRIVHAGYLHTDTGSDLRKGWRYRMLGGATRGVDILTRSHVFLLQAAERWCALNPAALDDLEILLVGASTLEDRAVAEQSGVAKAVRFLGYAPHTVSVDLIRTADLLFFPMHNLPPGRRCRIVPGKLYEYLAAERPILAAVPDGDARDFLERSGSAQLCRPDDVEEMCGHLDRAYQSWKSRTPLLRTNRPFVEQFERKQLTRTLAGALRAVAAESTQAERLTSAAGV